MLTKKTFRLPSILRRAALAAALLAGVAAAQPAAAIVYDVNIVFGPSASVTGFIETDGTIGTIAAANIVDWTITLTSPNLASGSPFTFSHAGNRTEISGANVSATATDLLYDFASPTYGYFILQDNLSTGNWLCIINDTGCYGGTGAQIGWAPGGVNAEFLPGTGSYSFAAVSEAVAVPEPGILALLGLGLVGMGFARRNSAFGFARRFSA